MIPLVKRSSISEVDSVMEDLFMAANADDESKMAWIGLQYKLLALSWRLDDLAKWHKFPGWVLSISEPDGLGNEIPVKISDPTDLNKTLAEIRAQITRFGVNFTIRAQDDGFALNGSITRPSLGLQAGETFRARIRRHRVSEGYEQRILDENIKDVDAFFNRTSEAEKQALEPLKQAWNNVKDLIIRLRDQEPPDTDGLFKLAKMIHASTSALAKTLEDLRPHSSVYEKFEPFQRIRSEHR